MQDAFRPTALLGNSLRWPLSVWHFSMLKLHIDIPCCTHAIDGLVLRYGNLGLGYSFPFNENMWET